MQPVILPPPSVFPTSWGPIRLGAPQFLSPLRDCVVYVNSCLYHRFPHLLFYSARAWSQAMTPAAIIAKWLWTLSYARTRVAQVLQGEGRKPVWQRSKLTPWSSRVVHVELVTSFKMGRFWVKEDS